jgi:hypothetical protein
VYLRSSFTTSLACDTRGWTISLWSLPTSISGGVRKPIGDTDARGTDPAYDAADEEAAGDVYIACMAGKGAAGPSTHFAGIQGLRNTRSTNRCKVPKLFAERGYKDKCPQLDCFAGLYDGRAKALYEVSTSSLSCCGRVPRPKNASPGKAGGIGGI